MDNSSGELWAAFLISLPGKNKQGGFTASPWAGLNCKRPENQSTDKFGVLATARDCRRGGHGLTSSSVPGFVMEPQNLCLAGAFSCFLKTRRNRDSSAHTPSRWTSGTAAPGRVTEQADRDTAPLRLRNRLKRLFTNSSHLFFCGTTLVMQISYRSSTVQCTYKGSHRPCHRSHRVKPKLPLKIQAFSSPTQTFSENWHTIPSLLQPGLDSEFGFWEQIM